MLTWLIRNRLAAFERKYDYDMTYAREILAADRKAIFRFAKLAGLGQYRGGAPKDARWAVQLVGTLREDCGPCTQLLVSLALEDGASPRVLSAVLAGRDAALPEEVLLAVRFARATLDHAPEADESREEIVRRWGPRALIELAFGLAGSRLFPTIKYALGHGKACQRVRVGDEQIAVAGRPADPPAPGPAPADHVARGAA